MAKGVYFGELQIEALARFLVELEKQAGAYTVETTDSGGWMITITGY